jgi:Domain of unknown function (DUF1906)
MRRTAVAVMGFGSAIGLFAAAGVSPASGQEPGARTQAGTLKTVDYDGYSITVPSSWPVFHLDTNPSQCVRYDINAVYLGNPGANQNCPSNLIGRAQTITIADTGVPGTPRAEYQRAAVAHGGLGAAPPPGSAGRRVASVPPTLSRLDQYGQQQEFQAAVSGSHLSVTGTYGASPGPVENIIQGVRKLDAQSSGSAKAAAELGLPTASGAQARETAATAGTLDRTRPSRAVRARKRGPHIPSAPLNGFDTCTAPSVNAMKAWKAKYSAIGVYIGGQNMACDYGNLSASWVRSAHARGWSLLPLYVGRQAPCNKFASHINRAHAASEGRSAANTAIADAANFGLGQGTPIYFDMESYNTSKRNCRAAVLTFLNTWTRELHDHGYASGVYTSASSGVTALMRKTVIDGHPLAEPDAVWFGLWDNHSNLTGTPYLPATRWAADRVKQYSGNTTQRVGGYTLHIDADRIGGAVSGP